uniref:Uncharacterized protein n=1 Tax=Cacopsylla melanoneura TaxID=428564 RepID=A0A8D8X6C3_9HEMI
MEALYNIIYNIIHFRNRNKYDLRFKSFLVTAFSPYRAYSFHPMLMIFFGEVAAWALNDEACWICLGWRQHIQVSIFIFHPRGACVLCTNICTCVYLMRILVYEEAVA